MSDIDDRQHLTAYIRRLAADGRELYVRLSRHDVESLGLRQGEFVRLEIGSASIAGTIKTSGSSPWLAPGEHSNGEITERLRAAAFEHGHDVMAVVNRARLPEGRAAVPSPSGQASVSRPPVAHATIHISVELATRAVETYNRGTYRGRLNVDVDRVAYERFADGLTANRNELVDLIRFVGEDYGGAQARFLPDGYQPEAELIVGHLLPILPEFNRRVGDSRPLLEQVPDAENLTALFEGFRGTKRWPVWASKTLHFLRPDVFPILDSRAKETMGLKNLGGTPIDYHRFCVRFRETMIANSASLDAARAVDHGTSPSDLKLLDKILYQVGSP